MVGRRDMGSWLDGPGGQQVPADPAADHPGARFGRPAEGAGAVASFGRRVVGLVVDWLLCVLIAQGLLSSVGRPDLMALVVLVTEHVLLVGTLGMTIGHRVAGIRVETLEGRPPGPARALVRALLLVLVVPPLFTDRDNRGLHDRAAGTVVVRSP